MAPKKSSLQLTDTANKILEARYLRVFRPQDSRETPADLFARVARAVAQAELIAGNTKQAARYEEIFLGMMLSLDFLPNSPTLMNAGTHLGQLSACFVLPVEDTIEDIFGALKNMAIIQRSGGGTGFSFSRLRPKGDFLSSTGGQSSGPVSFMRIFDCATSHIKQGGKRRGANLGSLRVDHPDIMDFITAKTDDLDFENFNLSVVVTDAFMNAVIQNHEYNLIHPRNQTTVGTLKSRDVFNAIAHAAWQTGDPGLIFYDAVNNANPTPQLGSIETTNPCGEIPLLPYESCNLGSINLAHMVRGEKGKCTIDWDKLLSTTQNAVRFLDDVLEVSKFPIQQVAQTTRNTRKIGLGLMGFAEMLIQLGISYNSEKAVEIAGQVMKAIQQEAHRTSTILAEERGVYSAWKGSFHEKSGLKMRNATCTAVAPTGTISLIAGTSAGIEPLFALAYRRSPVLGNQSFFEYNPLFRKFMEIHNLDTRYLTKKVLEKGRLTDIDEVPEHIKALFVTALEIPFKQHLKIQAAFQKHVDNSVSKTINIPGDATPEDVAQAYLQAWKYGLKGATIYRYGSKKNQILELGAGEKPYQYDSPAQCDPGECEI
ncbi:MAG: adenosylcobalamin-dependent ribonucleoside-diphosphate reductase [Desulfatiglandaceae bacterium]